jgi:hypothetical protein
MYKNGLSSSKRKKYSKPSDESIQEIFQRTRRDSDTMPALSSLLLAFQSLPLTFPGVAAFIAPSDTGFAKLLLEVTQLLGYNTTPSPF